MPDRRDSSSHRADAGRNVPERRRFRASVPGALMLLCAAAIGVASVWTARRGPADPPHAAPGAGVAEADVEPRPGSPAYVGSRACDRCHAGIARSFAEHPMARSITTVGGDDPEVAAAADKRVPGLTRVYDVEFRDGLMTHHDRMFDAEGALVYDQAVPVDYVVGSGRRAKAYLHRRGDLLFMSPLNWYSVSGKWDLAPGYVPDDPRRFGRRITEDCLGCHAGRVAAKGGSLQRFENPPFHEAAIGCENCHGPGGGHVAFHEGDAPGSGAADPIVNPARLDHARSEAVCYQCHLQAAARVPRYGRGDLDFRPGQLIRDVWTVLDRGGGVTSDGKTRSVNHVQQMRESACYRGSDGRLGCVSCHDPHGVPDPAGRVDFYRDRCLKCHDGSSCAAPPAARRERGDSCIDCHMPPRDSSNVSHVTQTDHRVVRRPDGPSGGEAETESLEFFDDADRSLPEWERNRALALAAWTHLRRTDRPAPPALARVLDGVASRVPDDGPVIAALGTMAATSGRTELARTYYERARRVPAAEEDALSGLLDLYYASGDRKRALECADRLVEINPWDARTHALRADLLGASGRRDEGIAAAERALELDPTMIPVRAWLADALSAAGRDGDARRRTREIERMRGARPPGPPRPAGDGRGVAGAPGDAPEAGAR